MVHMKILKKCGGELEHALRRRCIEPCSSEQYINALEDIVTRTKIGRTWKELDIKCPKKPFIKKDKPRETLKPNKSNNNEQKKCHKCGGIGHLANNCLQKAKIDEIVETKDHNDKEEESDTSESDEINTINEKINNIDLIYEVLDVNSNLPQGGTSDTSLRNKQDAKLYRTKPAKGIGYTAGKSSISIFMVENQEAKVNADTGAYFTCVVINNEENSPEKDFFITGQLKEAEFNHELTEKMKEKLIDLLFKYKNAFATDKEPLGSIIGNEADIILDVENPYPPLLRTQAYPASPISMEALEVHIK
ncbi:hypothetical protein O181_053884 [Austropuccinia psidii MF-1]|uniref:CCHC-type domain-containing protein n=1 Tax=Austropuccinia psidii MF-1 TaxID=1389203 RepID=A0A9Q3E3G5_9BASI|nr:hypothetical protein [Austropuccinia psidii MF-1]